MFELVAEERARIAVIGQGLMGLSSALRLLEVGFSVDVFSRDDFWGTCSTAAGAYWWPHKVYPEERVACWSKKTFEVYKQEQQNPEAGVRFEKHLRFCIDPDDSSYALDLVNEWQEVKGADYGLECEQTFLVTLPVIEVPIYMPYLLRKVEQAGGRFSIRELVAFSELSEDYDLLINCTGIGSRELARDEELFPIRGQALRVSALPELDHSTRVYKQEDEFTLVFPRSSDIVLGGTAQDNDWSLEPREEDSRTIFERCCSMLPELKDCKLLETIVGLRPGRSAVRLELEDCSATCPVIHNYGHGGAGYTVAWGCADEVCDLAKGYLRQED